MLRRVFEWICPQSKRSNKLCDILYNSSVERSYTVIKTLFDIGVKVFHSKDTNQSVRMQQIEK
jgi:hypothetical protein